MVPIVLIFILAISVSIRVLDGHLGLQILNDILVIMFSTYGAVATIFLIFFNTSYRKFLSGKLKEFGKSLSCLGEMKEIIRGNAQLNQLKEAFEQITKTQIKIEGTTAEDDEQVDHLHFYDSNANCIGTIYTSAEV
uniref:ABC transmembrane type-1 domain-containing protein n=1 Tax=Heterorhabditis bacteriophora TaxID=37862 RepID=A0A1I7X088_HETBA